MKKELTIILTIFTPTLRELNNYLYSFSKINEYYDTREIENPIQFLILGDNPNIPKDIEDFLVENFSKLENLEYKPCKENLVRLGQVFKHLDLVKGRYVKTVDPDDYLIPNKTVDFVENVIKNTEENNRLIIHSYRTVENIDIYWEAIMHCKHKVFFKNQSFNPNSVYPLEIIKKINWDNRTLIWSDDLIGFYLLNEGAKIKSERSSKFYVNLSHNGVSTTDGPHSNMRFYNDSCEFLKLAKKKIGNDINKQLMFSHITGKPSYWFCKQIYEDLYWNTSINRFKKAKLMKQFLKEVESISNLKGHWRWFKFGMKICFIFNIKWK